MFYHIIIIYQHVSTSNRVSYENKNYTYLYIVCILVWHHDDGRSSFQNMLVNNNIW